MSLFTKIWVGLAIVCSYAFMFLAGTEMYEPSKQWVRDHIAIPLGPYLLFALLASGEVMATWQRYKARRVEQGIG